jgi:hypothetical protein
MSRILLTELEQVDYDIGPVYVNPNYSYDVSDLLNDANMILSPPEINVMTPNKIYPKAIIDSGKKNRYLSNQNDVLTPISNRVLNVSDDTVKQSLLNIINSEQNIKEQFKSEYIKNNIDYNIIRNYYRKKN